MTRRKSIGELLLGAHLVDETQLAIALETQKRTGKKIGSVLIELRFVDENVLAAFLSKQIDVPCVSLLNMEIPIAVRKRLAAHLAHRFGAIPIAVTSGGLEVAMIDPTDIDQIVALEAAVGMRVDPLVAPESSIRKVLAKYYPLDEDGVPKTDFGEPVETALFPDLMREIGEGSGRISQRLDGIEGELRELRRSVEELLAELRPRVGR